MAYVYPKFSEHEIPGLRFGGPGLGNLLFIYSRALIFAKKNKYRLIWPTWPSLKIGPWIRHEKDKRFYGDLFQNNMCAIDGLKKEELLLFSHKIPVSKWNRNKQYSSNDVIEYDYFKMGFDELKPYQRYIKSNLNNILSSKSRSYAEDDFQKAVNVHIRLGDFSANPEKLANGANNTRISISWYKQIIIKIQQCVNSEIDFYVFSDGTDEELAEVLSLPNVKKKFYGNSIADIYALSQSPMMIASGSSFSLWARFLGQNSSISFPGQIKDHVLVEGNNQFEIELNEKDNIPDEIKKKLKALYD